MALCLPPFPQGGLSAQTYVHIEVEDLNDNVPVFNPEQYATSISSHAPPDTEILTAIATDPDSGRYGRVTYELMPSDLSGLFTLDGDTGRRRPPGEDQTLGWENPLMVDEKSQ